MSLCYAAARHMILHRRVMLISPKGARFRLQDQDCYRCFSSHQYSATFSLGGSHDFIKDDANHAWVAPTSNPRTQGGEEGESEVQSHPSSIYMLLRAVLATRDTFWCIGTGDEYACQSGAMTHACNPSTWKAEAGRRISES